MKSIVIIILFILFLIAEIAFLIPQNPNNEHPSFDSHFPRNKNNNINKMMINSELEQFEASTYAFGDFHGDLEVFLQNLKTVNLIEYKEIRDKKGQLSVPEVLESVKWIGGQNKLVITGDIMDRGQHDIEIWQILQKLHTQAKQVGGLVEPLLGNHEILNFSRDERYIHDRWRSPKELQYRHAMLSRTSELGKFIRERKTIFKLGSTVFVHGGLSPYIIELYGPDSINNINNIVRKCLMDNEVLSNACLNSNLFDGIEGPFWTREYSGPTVDESIMCPSLKDSLLMLRAHRMVVGHTIQPGSKVNARCGGRLVMIDVGLSRSISSSNDKKNVFSAGIKISQSGQAQSLFAVKEIKSIPIN